MSKQGYKKPVAELIEVEANEVMATSDTFVVSDEEATEPGRVKRNFWID